MQRAVIDRFEGEFAILVFEGQAATVDVLRNQLPSDAKAGDHFQVEVTEGKIVQIVIDPEATDAARERIAAKLNRLRRGEHLGSNDASMGE